MKMIPYETPVAELLVVQYEGNFCATGDGRYNDNNHTEYIDGDGEIDTL